MSTSVNTVVQRVRRKLNDYPTENSIRASISSSATIVDVGDSSLYYTNETLEVESESMQVRGTNSATEVIVKRGAFGSTAASHVNGSDILVKPRFSAIQIIDAIADAIDAAYPWIYKRVIDTSLTASSNTYEYTIPDMPSDSGHVIDRIWRVETKLDSEYDWVRAVNWSVVRAATPKLRFNVVPPSGSTIRIHGYGQFPRLADTSSTLDAQWPRNLEYPLADYAAALCLASGEYSRVAIDRGVIDDREQANKPGVSMAASQYAYNLWLRRVQQSGFPPMLPHKRTFLS